MRLVFLVTAVEDLVAIRSFIDQDNAEAAQKVAARLKEIINGLKKLPSLGKPGRIFGTRELVTPPIGKTAYVIVYRASDQRIEILRILHGARDIDSLLLEKDDDD
ncbi:MAG TPA: type II toxin-antitoxin system mRNA interferase toxin, RelE/StbE family [Cyanobacteria bacterium UBA8803]|nr:type II toxin-antitoxin system mRNA interferase toxin, RelE/StbE family [Cyanobacteria bacterium UBA9273]HBL58742.1 type II toxin-antitoxin system mRNA interferase toxin, RelE/StbE family [Cyanobacteria bacterium UBA8803]